MVYTPTHNTRSTHAWIEKGAEREQLSVSGRDRVNINAALNALDGTDVLAIECSSVNSQSTRELYERILASNPSAKSIYIISDNARYYRGLQRRVNFAVDSQFPCPKIAIQFLTGIMVLVLEIAFFFQRLSLFLSVFFDISPRV